MIAQLTMDQARFVGGGGAASTPTSAEVGLTAAAIGGGVGASLAISHVGGLAGVGALGPAAVGLLSGAGAGIAGSWYAGTAIGTYAYENSTTVQSAANSTVEAVMGAVTTAGDAFKKVIDYVTEQVDDQ